uniref:Uncharacterized protein n=1 Tax=Oryza brachyantha TaxID=4533 RepID=J3LGY2_ORYBR
MGFVVVRVDLDMTVVPVCVLVGSIYCTSLSFWAMNCEAGSPGSDINLAICFNQKLGFLAFPQFFSFD